jgi:DNA-directed RNA polymerase specialized sigma24 family protein
LWQILLMLVGRKAVDQRRRQNAQKHGGKRIRGESVWQNERRFPNSRPGLDQVDAGLPSPAFAADVAEQFQRLLLSLGDELLSQIALAKMEGWTNAELAQRFELSERSIERKLGLIRKLWNRDGTF